MASTSILSAPDGGVSVTGELAAVLARLGELTDAAVTDPAAGDREADGARIDQIALLERIQAAAAAAQAAVMVGFARSQVAAPRKAAMLARKYAYQADPQGYVARGRTARADRRVTVHPAPDTMTIPSGFLPMKQGVACWAALRRHTDTLKSSGDPRTP